jgi:EpsI family protein
MTTLSHRYRVAIVTLAVVAPLAVFLQYNVPAQGDLGLIRDRVPQVFGSWVMSAEREPDEKEIQILETKAILGRTYTRGRTEDVDLSIVYAPNNRRVAHPPEVCYKGSGWSVERSEVYTFPVGGKPFQVNRLLLIQGTKRLLVLYWYKAGPNYYASYIRMQWGIIWSQLTLRSSSSALLRASANSSGPDEDAAIYATLEEFVATALPEITPALP